MFKSKGFLLGIAIILGVIVYLLPRPEGTQFKVSGDAGQLLAQSLMQDFTITGENTEKNTYVLVAKNPGTEKATHAAIIIKAAEIDLKAVQVDYVDGLSPKAKRFLTILVVLVFMFVLEPIPLELTAICIGAGLVLFGIADVKTAWAPYMNPVVVFIMCCLIFAISLDKVGITKRLGYFIIKQAGDSVTKFTFIIAVGLGWASGVMHDAAAAAIGIVTMLPLMKAAGIKPHSKTAKFMMLAIPFACSCGGMMTLMGGGRCMVSAAFLKEFTGIEITFFQWMTYAGPIGFVTTPIAVLLVYLVFRPNPKYKLPQFEENLGPITTLEKKVLAIIGITFCLWMTKGLHGIHYSVTGMLGVTALVIAGTLKWEDINDNMEWGTAPPPRTARRAPAFAMGYSGAATYFAHLFFPYVQGGGWLLLFCGVAVFGALVTNAMANVAAAALILPIVIPMAQLEGVDPTVLAL